jgi:Fur family ferric uptake transcriptional regulator
MSEPKKNSLPPIRVARSPAERFDDFLQSRGMRQTAQRKLMIGYISEQHEHFDADQLMDRMPSRGVAGYVSRPTVYRTLAEFVDAGLLRKFDLDGRSVYEVDYGYPQHDHLYCSECERLIEFQSDELLAIKTVVAAQHNFQVSSHRLIITGVCEECRSQRRRVRRRVDRI